MAFIWSNIQNKQGASTIRTALNGLGNQQSVTYTNISVPTNLWVGSATYSAYPYQATLSCSGIDASYSPDVRFDVDQATSGMFSPVAKPELNAVIIYANSIPSGAFTIPTIIFTKGGN